MKIGIIGTGYVGLVTGACLSDFGMDVVCMDSNVEKIEQLSQGNLPIYEPGLEEFVHRNLNYRRLSFSYDIQSVVEDCDVLFICVGTPPAADGSVDMGQVLSVAEAIGRYLNGYKVIVNKSTVPVGSTHRVRQVIQDILDNRQLSDMVFDVVSNPEFLRQGNAIQEFTHTDRIVIGSDSPQAIEMMKKVYRVLYLNQTPFVITTPETAEIIKYAANAFLATKISFINEMANLCEAHRADVHHVAHAMGMDGRISPKFLHPGPGYGGSCFPKDTRALAWIGRNAGAPMTIVEAAIAANESQKRRMADRIKQALGENLHGKTLAVLGLTFKPRTNDMREAPSLTILPELAASGAKLQAFDPQGHIEGPSRFAHLGDSLTLCNDAYTAAAGADAVVLLTEWNQFRTLDLQLLHQIMKDYWFFDLRNMYERIEVEAAGFRYEGVGR